jgi:hypothetical protein
MKTKNRKIIGQILIWLALIVQAWVTYNLFAKVNIEFGFIGYPAILLITIIMLLVGGLSMRKTK